MEDLILPYHKNHMQICPMFYLGAPPVQYLYAPQTQIITTLRMLSLLYRQHTALLHITMSPGNYEPMLRKCIEKYQCMDRPTFTSSEKNKN